MATQSRIEWTESTWNPVTGCTKVGPGCEHCYAQRLALRLQAMGNPRYRNGFRVTRHDDLLETPLRWRRPRTVFVNSMSDLFHEQIPGDFILRVFETMAAAPRHIFQILTKRPARLRDLDKLIEWPPNVWMGVSVEDGDHWFRAGQLRATGAQVKFVSLEPLLGPVPQLDLDGLDWIIVGGESGPGARPMRRSWVVDVWRQCHSQSVPFFFKQWGGVQRTKAGRLLNGRTWSEYPDRREPQDLLPLRG